MNTRLQLASLTLVLCIGCTDRKPGKIVFTSSRDGNLEIYSMNADGQNQQRLTDNPGNDDSPRWSPDGSEILFASDRDGFWNLFVMNADGTNLRQITTGDGNYTSPAWVKDGKGIIFISFRDTINGEIYRSDRNGGNIERLTRDGFVKEYAEIAGERIIFTLNDREQRSIALLDLKTLQRTILRPMSLRARISREGDQIVYLAYAEGNFAVYRMNLANRSSVRISSTSADEFAPTWAEGDRAILYSRMGGIYKRPLPDGKEIMLTAKGDTSPDWFEE